MRKRRRPPRAASDFEAQRLRRSAELRASRRTRTHSSTVEAHRRVPGVKTTACVRGQRARRPGSVVMATAAFAPVSTGILVPQQRPTSTRSPSTRPSSRP